jgi:hypothetical protein
MELNPVDKVYIVYKIVEIFWNVHRNLNSGHVPGISHACRPINVWTECCSKILYRVCMHQSTADNTFRRIYLTNRLHCSYTVLWIWGTYNSTKAGLIARTHRKMYDKAKAYLVHLPNVIGYTLRRMQAVSFPGTAHFHCWIKFRFPRLTYVVGSRLSQAAQAIWLSSTDSAQVVALHRPAHVPMTSTNAVRDWWWHCITLSAMSSLSYRHCLQAACMTTDASSITVNIC